MNCKLHPQATAVDACANCNAALCGECVVHVNSRPYCDDCKMTAVDTRPRIQAGTITCREARRGLIYGLTAFLLANYLHFFLGVLGIGFGVAAIALCLNALAAIDKDYRLSGYGNALGALIFGMLGVGGGLWTVIVTAGSLK